MKQTREKRRDTTRTLQFLLVLPWNLASSLPWLALKQPCILLSTIGPVHNIRAVCVCEGIPQASLCPLAVGAQLLAQRRSHGGTH